MLNDYLFSILLYMVANTVAFSQSKNIAIQWQKIATLPGPDGDPSLGFAGSINAISGESLIVAGGANFPDKMPWNGGKKSYSDEIYILQKKDGSYIWNTTISTKLPEPIAYCGNIATELGIVYAGGENSKGISNKAYLIKFNETNKEVKIDALPNLPLAVTNIALTSIGSIVYAIGGDELVSSSSCFFCIDLKSKDRSWERLPDLPIALANTVALVQNGKKGNNIYVVGGRSKNPSGISSLHSTLFIYNPSTRAWLYGNRISDDNSVTNLSAATGVSISDRYLLITGGDNGKIFHKIEILLYLISQSLTDEVKAELANKKNKLITNHRGFYRGILLYDTVNNVWSKIGDLPFPARVTTTAIKWGQDIIISNGEIKPGVRSPDIMLGKILN